MIERITDLERRQAKLIRAGKIAEIDYTAARVKVKIGLNITAWIPWIAGKAGGNSEWNPPEVGEQVVVISPGGDFSNGFALVGIYQNASEALPNSAAPGSSGDVRRSIFGDGATIDYDRKNHVYAATLPAAGKSVVTTGAATVTQTKDSVVMTVGGTSLTVKDGSIVMALGGNTITFDAGGATVSSGDVKAGAISLTTHKHSDPQGGTTGAPV
ncbi:MAG: phage baseplate assembly protein V [Chthoniobacteraceae bacterium]